MISLRILTISKRSSIKWGPFYLLNAPKPMSHMRFFPHSFVRVRFAHYKFKFGEKTIAKSMFFFCCCWKKYNWGYWFCSFSSNGKNSGIFWPVFLNISHSMRIAMCCIKRFKPNNSPTLSFSRTFVDFSTLLLDHDDLLIAIREKCCVHNFALSKQK